MDRECAAIAEPGRPSVRLRCISYARVLVLADKAGLDGKGTIVDRDGSLKMLVDRVIATVHPIRIILFGSTARQQDGPDSDLDVLVVMPDKTHRRHTAQLLYRSLRGVGVPFDLVVATELDISKHRNTPGLVYRSALNEGIEVYAA